MIHSWAHLIYVYHIVTLIHDTGMFILLLGMIWHMLSISRVSHWTATIYPLPVLPYRLFYAPHLVSIRALHTYMISYSLYLVITIIRLSKHNVIDIKHLAVTTRCTTQAPSNQRQRFGFISVKAERGRGQVGTGERCILRGPTTRLRTKKIKYSLHKLYTYPPWQTN